jgi:hypothetical protein
LNLYRSNFEAANHEIVFIEQDNWPTVGTWAHRSIVGLADRNNCIKAIGPGGHSDRPAHILLHYKLSINNKLEGGIDTILSLPR